MTNQLAAFCVNGYFGLCSLDAQVLAPEYQAVWPMLAGKFWGYRRGAVFGVLAADGAEIMPCELPACYYGYRELSTVQEQRALQVSEARFLSYMREQYSELRILDSSLCTPTTWMVEELTPALEREHQSLYFETPAFTLVLSEEGTWAWKQPANVPLFKPVVFATADPVTFTLTSPHDFTEATPTALLNWRMSYCTPTGAQEAQWVHENTQQVAEEYDRLVDVPTGTPDWWELKEAPMYLHFSLLDFSAQVLSACLRHLQPLGGAGLHPGPLLERLIYLAWLWANGYVSKTYLPPYYVVDARYIIDSAWFEHAPIQQVYLDYQLQALEPLLAQMLAKE